jgi:hypothetical protein
MGLLSEGTSFFTHGHDDDEDQGNVYAHDAGLHENGDVNEFYVRYRLHFRRAHGNGVHHHGYGDECGITERGNVGVCAEFYLKNRSP